MRFIVAVDEKWGIGKDGDLLISIPDDMRYYRETTRGKVVLMGYTTLISLPGSKPQPGRLNIVLNNEPGCRAPGAVVCSSIEQALRLAGGFDGADVFVIGGGSIYRQLMPYCEAAHITKMRFDGGADTYIPCLDEIGSWSVAEESEILQYEGIDYSFVIYKNSAPLAFPTAERLSPDMSVYFRKKEPVEVELCGDERYMRELTALLTAYFYPLKDGFTADEVQEYLDCGTGETFEEYLLRTGRIAGRKEVEAFCEKHGHSEKGRRITATGEMLSDGQLISSDK